MKARKIKLMRNYGDFKLFREKYAGISSLSAVSFTETELGIEVLLEEKIDTVSKQLTLKIDNYKKVDVSNDTVALIVGSLIQDKYSTVYFNFDVSPETLAEIKDICGTSTEIHAISTNSALSIRSGTSTAIQYSGGFDSTLLRVLYPEAHVFHLEYDEEPSQLPEELSNGVKIIHTNHDEFLFKSSVKGSRNVGVHLNADDLNIGYVLNGKISTDGETSFRHIKNIPVRYNRMDILTPLASMTKVGIIKALMRESPEYYAACKFDNSGSKALLIEMMEIVDTGEIPLKIRNQLSCFENKFRIFYCIYFIKKMGMQNAKLFFSDIPVGIEMLTDNRRLDFYEKCDIDMLSDMPQGWLTDFQNRLEVHGIEVYDEQDKTEFEEVLHYMGL